MVNDDKNLHSHKGSYKFIEAIKNVKLFPTIIQKIYIIEIMF